MGWRMLSSIRARMAVLILASAVPLLALAVVVSWQGYDSAIRESRERMQIVRAAAVARHKAALAGAYRTMDALAQAPRVQAAIHGATTDGCTLLLRDVQLIDSGRYVGIAVVDAAGATVCAVGADGAWIAQAVQSPWFAVLGRAGQATLGPLRPDAGAPLLPIADAIRAGGQVVGAVLALARVNWLTDPLGDGANAPASWLIAPSGAVIDTGAPRPGDLPPPKTIQHLLRGFQIASARSQGGHPFGYASADLGNGLRLLLGEPMTPAEASARGTLLLRVASILILVILGLAAVLLGANAAVVAPVKRLEDAVRSWRRGGAFDRAVAETLPGELRDLAISFAEASEVLTEREAQLRGALRQQELLMQEIHHRVKNNLQIIASLLNLQASRIRQPQARTEFESARDRVRALATLHRYLYSNSEVHTINMRNFLAELCGQLFEAMGEVEGERIQLDIEAPELRMLSDQAVPLSLIVTEVVGNALKYAFPDGRRGRIGIRLTAAETTAELLIEDDGIGLTHAATDLPPGSAPGIGIQLINGFVRQLRARLEIDESAGTRYVMTMPVHRERTLDQAGATA